MTWNQLSKQNKLLIYMYSRECSGCTNLTVKDSISDAVAYGISKNKKSLSTMLCTLQCKGLVERCGSNSYSLTGHGSRIAVHLLAQHEDIEMPDFSRPQPNGNASNQRAEGFDDEWTALASAFEKIVQYYAKQPKQSASCTDEAEADALYEQIAELKDEMCSKDKQIAELKDEISSKDEQIARIKKAHHQTCSSLDKKTKQLEYYENAFGGVEKAFSDAAGWCAQIKLNAPA